MFFYKLEEKLIYQDKIEKMDKISEQLKGIGKIIIMEPPKSDSDMEVEEEKNNSHLDGWLNKMQSNPNDVISDKVLEEFKKLIGKPKNLEYYKNLGETLFKFLNEEEKNSELGSKFTSSDFYNQIKSNLAKLDTKSPSIESDTDSSDTDSSEDDKLEGEPLLTKKIEIDQTSCDGVYIDYLSDACKKETLECENCKLSYNKFVFPVNLNFICWHCLMHLNQTDASKLKFESLYGLNFEEFMFENSFSMDIYIKIGREGHDLTKCARPDCMLCTQIKANPIEPVQKVEEEVEISPKNTEDFILEI